MLAHGLSGQYTVAEAPQGSRRRGENTEDHEVFEPLRERGPGCVACDQYGAREDKRHAEVSLEAGQRSERRNQDETGQALPAQEPGNAQHEQNHQEDEHRLGPGHHATGQQGARRKDRQSSRQGQWPRSRAAQEQSSGEEDNQAERHGVEPPRSHLRIDARESYGGQQGGKQRRPLGVDFPVRISIALSRQQAPRGGEIAGGIWRSTHAVALGA